MKLINDGNKNYYLLNNVHAYEFKVGNFYGLSINYTETVNDKTAIRNLIGNLPVFSNTSNQIFDAT